MRTAGLRNAEGESVPLWMLAELTYKCPLQCPYCSNPLEMARIRQELTADEWYDVLEQGRAMGAVQLGFSGGEPLLKPGLPQIVRKAHELGFYTNLITSGLGLNEKSIRGLKDAGLDHIQLSVQAHEAGLNDQIAGRKCFAEKVSAAALIKDHGFPMVMNVVLHRHNIENLRDIIELAISFKADYLELANVQFDGWAYLNRSVLLPGKEQVEAALRICEEYQDRLKGKMQIIYVLPDYYSDRPKACCSGWGNLSIVVSPSGAVLPCLGAHKLPVADIPNIRSDSLANIWRHSKLFNAFRGDSWMKEPCRSCPERFEDFGGCRCQAYLLTGDASNPDPVCKLAPQRNVIDQLLGDTSLQPFESAIHRTFARSKSFCLESSAPT